MTAILVRRLGLMLLLYAVLISLAGFQFARAPTGFIPDQDQSYLITVIQLPPGSTLGRTEAVVRQVAAIVEKTPGVSHAVPFVALDATTFTQASNSATVFSKLAPFDERVAHGLDAPTVLASLRTRLAGIESANIFSIAPPPVQGLGSAGGFKLEVQDRGNVGPEALERAAQTMVASANADPALAGVFTLFNTKTPSVYADIDRERAEKLGVTPHDVFAAMQVYLGSEYINDFNYLGRTYEVIAQADGPFRQTLNDISRLRTRNSAGQMVPIGSVAQLEKVTIPYRIPHYNLYPAAEVLGVLSAFAPASIARLDGERDSFRRLATHSRQLRCGGGSGTCGGRRRLADWFGS